MNIKTTYEYPPIPIRDMDWSAIDKDTYDEGAPIGRGRTEAEAIIDLIEQIRDQEAEEQLELLTEVEKSLAYAGMVLEPPAESQWNDTHRAVKKAIAKLEGK